MTQMMPEPTSVGVLRALEYAGLQVTPEGERAIEGFAQPVEDDRSLMEGQAQENLLLLVEEIAGRGRDNGGVVDADVVALALRGICPLPPWCR
jgi:hypothetical protein